LAAAKSRCKRDEDGCPPNSAESKGRKWAQPTLQQKYRNQPNVRSSKTIPIPVCPYIDEMMNISIIIYATPGFV